MPFDLEKFIDQKQDWSRRTFGEGRRTHGLIAHIKKELDEISLAPLDLEEWVDVILLAMDGASRAGYTGEEIVDAIITKQMKNVMRKWKMRLSEDEPMEHERDEP